MDYTHRSSCGARGGATMRFAFIVSFYPGFCLISYQHILTSSRREVKVIKIKSTWGHYLNKFIVNLISMISMYLRVRAGVGIRHKHRWGKMWFLHAGPRSITHFGIIWCWHSVCVILHFFEHKPIMLLKFSDLKPFVNNRHPLFGLWSYFKGQHFKSTLIILFMTCAMSHCIQPALAWLLMKPMHVARSVSI